MSDEPVPNQPELWTGHLPRPDLDGHKYHRGYTAIYAAPELTGATRLAATACSRVGSGLVSVVARVRGDIYRSTLPPDIMVHDAEPAKATVVLGGPGGVDEVDLEAMLNATTHSGRVFDAGAIPSARRFDRLDGSCVLTPHTGEFERAFGPLGTDPVRATHRIAANSGAVLVLKSARTIIADGAGRTVVNTHTSPYLAKAGTGDVLAGMIAGLLAQGMPPFEASCAAVWMHGEAGRRVGPGLVAGDIVDALPAVLRALLRVERPRGVTDLA